MLQQSALGGAPRVERRFRRAEQAVEREAEQAKDAKLQTAISVGATLLGAMLGRKAVSRSSVGRATTAARGVGRSMKQAQDVGRARATVEATARRLADLEAEFEAKLEDWLNICMAEKEAKGQSQ